LPPDSTAPTALVARGLNQAEGELIQGLLRDAGVPSSLRRTAGFDVPDFLAAGPRDVMVPESHAALARQTLGESAIGPPEDDGAPYAPRPLWVVAGVLALGLAGLLLTWALF
jgi:hypothetical protein